MFWKRKRLYSQNFLINRELIKRLIRATSITRDDMVLDIGSGKGAITQELLKVTPKVIAIEKDPQLSSHPQDFLTYELPRHPYKVFANIPFSITSDIIRKLLHSQNPPQDCYLVVQAEAANKFIIDSTNTLVSLLYYPWWEFKIVHRFKSVDFQPRPHVESVLLHIHPRIKPLLPFSKKTAYYDFVSYGFIYNPKAKYISPREWLLAFKCNTKNLSGTYSRLQKEQDSLQKIHRTRTDNKWRSFR